MNFILIIFAHVGLMGSGNSNSVAIAEFTTIEKCVKAKGIAVSMSAGSTKVIKAECVEK